MRRTVVRAVAAGLRQALAPEARAFERALAAPAAAQHAALRRIVTGLAATEYGRAHGLAAGDGYGTFAARLPVVTYDDLRRWIERQMREGAPALVAGPVRAWVKTSGSSGPAKYVPYPAALRRSFGRLLRLWLVDLASRGPALDSGRTWISVSPALGPPETLAGGVPVGLDSDLDLADAPLRRLLSPFMAVPLWAGRLRDPEAVKRVLACALVARRPEVVSIWSPSFLLALLEWIARHRALVAGDLRRGTVSVEGMAFSFPPPASSLLRALQAEPIRWPRILPELKLISCWLDGPAAAPAADLRQVFPDAAMQGKGLLATEAPITVPWTAAGGCVPLLHEVFLEFVAESGAIRGLHELSAGAEYSLLLTQSGGLARYRIGDRVRVAGFHHATPVLVFVGREGQVSDMVGEKLDERFVRAALEALPLGPHVFRMLLPSRQQGAPARYVLLVDRAALGTGAAVEDLAGRLDGHLQRAHRYQEARMLGQLAPPEVVVLPSAQDRLLDAIEAAGTPRGAIKPASMARDPALAERVLAASR
jgi:hypothetical protein